MATITMDFDEFEKLKTKASCNEAKIKEEVNREFNNWRRQYEYQRDYNLSYSKEGILEAIGKKKTLCANKQNSFGLIKAGDVKRYFEEIEDLVREM